MNLQPINPISKEELSSRADDNGLSGMFAFVTIKLNELIDQHNALLESFQHHAHYSGHDHRKAGAGSELTSQPITETDNE